MLEILRDVIWIPLFAISLIYSAIVRLLFSFRKVNKLSIPVLSVGNIHVGGTGKTPLVIKLAQHFKGHKPAIATRGYKSQVTPSGAQCDLSDQNGPQVFGDEPWLIALKSGCEVFIGKDRLRTLLRFHVEKNHSLVILDDGFQHTFLERAVDLVLIPGESDPSTSACIPLGTLRESLLSLKRASAVLLTSGAEENQNLTYWKNLIEQIAPGLPLFVAHRKPFQIMDSNHSPAMSQAGNWGAFCGIARPDRFFSDLKKWGEISQELIFPDHHKYRKSDIQGILKTGEKHGIFKWITTEKDYVKVESSFKSLSDSNSHLFYAPIDYEYPVEFLQFIERKLSAG